MLSRRDSRKKGKFLERKGQKEKSRYKRTKEPEEIEVH